MASDNINDLQQLIMHGGEEAFSLVPLTLAKVIKEKQWSERNDRHGKPFASFEGFATHRLWQGLETSIDDLLIFCRKHPDVQRLIKEEMDTQPTHSDAGSKGGRGNKATYNVRSLSGNSSTHILKRLKRDRPDLAEKVIAGEMSAHAAALKAGFRKRRRCPHCGGEI